MKIGLSISATKQKRKAAIDTPHPSVDSPRVCMYAASRILRASGRVPPRPPHRPLRMGDMFVPTRREAPADAVLPSHKLLVRGGLIRTVCFVPRLSSQHSLSVLTMCFCGCFSFTFFLTPPCSPPPRWSRLPAGACTHCCPWVCGS